MSLANPEIYQTQSPEDAPEPKRVCAAIMVIGDEILSGRTQDINVNQIARFLASLGVDLDEVRMVRDDQDQIISALNSLRHQYDYVLTTGGIGPTHDDITADCVAKAFGVALIENAEARKALEDRANRLNMELNANSLRMTRIPEGARLIRNPVSAAPGIHIDNVFVMAGVPRIMQSMLEDVAPYLRQGQKVVSRTLKLVFVGESSVADVLRQLDHDYPDLSFGSYPFGFVHAEDYGTQLVVRGRDSQRVNQAFETLFEGLKPVLDAAKLKNNTAYMTEVTA